jgi:methylated-DNA-[protein]-cysteine S-methyltransferase
MKRISRRAMGTGGANRVRLDAHSVGQHHPILVEAERQLSEYFAEKRTQFQLSLEPPGTEFQRKVWQSLREIPFGKTKSYMEVAQAIGSPGAYRAIRVANGRNPLPLSINPITCGQTMRQKRISRHED